MTGNDLKLPLEVLHKMSDVLNVAVEFARSLAAGDAKTAHKLLCRKLAAEVPAESLTSQFEALAEDMGGVTGVGQPMIILEDWPEMSEHDLAMVYVPLEGDVFSEAVTVTVAKVDNTFCVSAIQWGRP